MQTISRRSTSDSFRGVPLVTGLGRWGRYVAALVVLDTLSIVVAVVIALFVRFGSLQEEAPGQIPYLAVAALMAIGWMFALVLGRSYEQRFLGAGPEEYRHVFAAAIRFIGIVAVIALVLKIDVARGFVAISIPLATIFALSGRYAARRWLHHQRERGQFQCPLVAAGSEASVRELHADLMQASFTGFNLVAAWIPGRDAPVEVEGKSIPVMSGTLKDVCLRTRAGAVAVTHADALSADQLRELGWELEGSGIDILVTPDLIDAVSPRVSVRPVAGLPLVHVEEPELAGMRRVAKEAVDRVVAAILLVLFLPLFVLVGAAVKATSRGPMFFRQVRVGHGGRRFVLWKFRTMTVDAEARLFEVLHLNEHDGPLFKLTNDPRTTTVGRTLRRWSLDELPQLWNVLRGDMSVVGPRPPLPAEVENFDAQARRRLLVKPGMTGLWQVNGRFELPWEDAVRLDLHYVENWSPSMDAMILAKTAVAVVRRRGAC